MNPLFKIVLSPSKSLIETNKIVYQPSVPIFKNEAAELIEAIKRLGSADIKSLMTVSESIAETNYRRFQTWKQSNIDDSDLLQVISAFSGEVFKALDFESIDFESQNKASNSIFILSGLYGILRPYDLISPYRLEMGLNFSPNKNTKNLYSFWSNKINDFFLKNLKNDELLINLASQEYIKVIDTSILKNRIVTPIFKEFKNGKFTIVAIYAKHARGAMARYLVERKLETIEDLKLYDVDGYRFDASQSSKDEWVFIR